jgi:hypothetical protein
VTFRRNGLLTPSHQLPLIPREGVHQIGVAAVDLFLRQFVPQANAVCEAAEVSPPFVMGMMVVKAGRREFIPQTALSSRSQPPVYVH